MDDIIKASWDSPTEIYLTSKVTILPHRVKGKIEIIIEF